MKKAIALLLLLTLVISFGVFVSAEETVSTVPVLSPSSKDVGPDKTGGGGTEGGGTEGGNQGAKPAVLTGTKADGTKITATIDQVLLTADQTIAGATATDIVVGEELKKSLETFFETAKADGTTLTYGGVNFGDLFKEVVEDTILVPLPVKDLHVGQKVKVTLSNGTVLYVVCKEAGVVYVPFPKDAYYIGYVISDIPAATPETIPETTEDAPAA